jgi:hypothetical protein
VSGKETSDGLVHRMDLGPRGFEGCHRADFSDEIVQMVPKERVNFHKDLEDIVDRWDGGKLLLKFVDGTVEEADSGMYDLKNTRCYIILLILRLLGSHWLRWNPITRAPIDSR